MVFGRSINNYFKAGKHSWHLFAQCRQGSKGGTIGAFLDPGAVLPTLASLRRRAWRLAQTPLDDLSGDWKTVSKLYRDTTQGLESAAIEERASRLAWLAEMENAFGPGTRRQDIVETTDRFRDAVAAAGLGGRRAAPLLECLDRFRGVHYDDAIRAASVLRDESDALRALPEYGRARSNAITSSRELAEVLGAFLADVEASLANLEAPLAKDAASIPLGIEAIASALGALSDVLSRSLP